MYYLKTHPSDIAIYREMSRVGLLRLSKMGLVDVLPGTKHKKQGILLQNSGRINLWFRCLGN